MRASKNLYRQVANECSSYAICSDCKNKSDNDEDMKRSCLNCRHFAADEHCMLNLYDPIVNRLS